MEVNFNIAGKVQNWAKRDEFLTAKKIAIVNFQRLSKAKGETTALFVDSEGFTFRLTFIDIDNGNKIRGLEIHSQGFKRDLAEGVRKEFKKDTLPIGQPITLRAYKEKMTIRGVEKEVNRWELLKAEGGLYKINNVPAQPQQEYPVIEVDEENVRSEDLPF